MDRRNIGARLVLDSSGTWKLVEDTTVQSTSTTQHTTRAQLLKTTGPDGNVMFFLGNQSDNQTVASTVVAEKPLLSKPTHTVSAPSNTSNTKSQLTEEQAKSLAKLFSSVKTQMSSVKQPDPVPQNTSNLNNIPQSRSADPKLENQQNSVPFEQKPMLSKMLPQFLKEGQQEDSQPQISTTTIAGYHGSGTLNHGALIRPSQVISNEAAVIHLPSGRAMQIRQDLALSGKSLLKNGSSQPQIKHNPPHTVQSTDTFSDKGVFLGTYKVPGTDHVTSQNQTRIDPILSRFATTLAQDTNPSSVLKGNTTRVIPATRVSAQSNQLVVINPKPVATVKPEPATPIYSNQQLPVTLVNPSYVAMVPTGVPTFYHPIILNQTPPQAPTIVQSQSFTQSSVGKTIILNSNQSWNQDTTAPFIAQASESERVEKEVVPPEVCAEVVVGSNESVSSGQYELGIPEEPPVPRIESVFSLTQTDDTDMLGELTEKNSPVPTVDGDDGFDTSTESTGKRKRKKPKRFIPDDLDSPPRKCPFKKKTFLKPIVFNPCFIVLERVHIDVFNKPRKTSKGKKAKTTIKNKCSQLCRERFLRRLCEKKCIPCNRYFDRPDELQKLEVKQKYSKKQNIPNVKHFGLALDEEDVSVQQNSVTRRKNQSNNAVMERESRSDHSFCKARFVPTVVENQDSEAKTEVYVPETAKIRVQTTIAKASPDPKSPSSETESAMSESFIASEQDDVSPVKSSNNASSEDGEVCTEDTSIEPADTAGTSAVIDDSPSPPREFSPTVHTSNSPEPQSPSSFQDIDEYLFSRDDDKQIEETHATKEESDDDWGNMELEVDPDSEPDEDSKRGPSPTSVSRLSNVPPELPESVPELEPSHERSPESPPIGAQPVSTSANSPVLNEKVQRLKAMLAEQSRQVDNLRRLRRRTK